MRRRRSDLAWIAGGLVGLATTGWLASGGTASEPERVVFTWFNGASDSIYPVVWPLMQYGTFVTIPLVTIATLVLGRTRLAVELASAGIAVYLLAKLAKAIWVRDRPGRVLEEVQLRGVGAGEHGFPSGHAAVSAAIAFILFAFLPRRWRWVPVALAVVVSLGRLYVGAHLPLDVVGGACLGLVAGAVATYAGGVPGR
ncbi:MAG: phosphatase PAP2 family protein [Actinomycetota bacterium]